MVAGDSARGNVAPELGRYLSAAPRAAGERERVRRGGGEGGNVVARSCNAPGVDVLDSSVPRSRPPRTQGCTESSDSLFAYRHGSRLVSSGSYPFKSGGVFQRRRSHRYRMTIQEQSTIPSPEPRSGTTYLMYVSTKVLAGVDTPPRCTRSDGSQCRDHAVRSLASRLLTVDGCCQPDVDDGQTGTWPHRGPHHRCATGCGNSFPWHK